MGKLFLLTSSLVITPFVLLLCIVYLSYLTQYTTQQATATTVAETNYVHPGLDIMHDPTTQKKDLTIEQKIEAVRHFFAKHNSPLEPYAVHIVEYAEFYDLDYRLLPAIAMQESGLCRRYPKNSYNCWGYGIYGGKVTRFTSFDEAIATITKVLAVNYKARHGLHTPEEIAQRYTPSDNGKWVNSVSYYMNQLQ